MNGIDFLSGDFDVGIDGDLLTAGIAAAAAAFFFLTYGAITAGKKKRKKRSEDETYTDQASWIPSWITGKNFQIFECTFIVQYNFEPFVFCALYFHKRLTREKSLYNGKIVVFALNWRAIMHVNQAARARTHGKEITKELFPF